MRGLWMATYGGLAYFEGRHAAQGDGGPRVCPEGYLRLVPRRPPGPSLAGHDVQHLPHRQNARSWTSLPAGAQRLSAVSFDASDGLRSTRDPARQPIPGFRARDGPLWFATAKGLAVVDPARVSVDAPAPPVAIEGLTRPTGALCPWRPPCARHFPPAAARSRSSYAATSFTSSRQGCGSGIGWRASDRDWVDAGSGHQRVLQQPAAGRVHVPRHGPAIGTASGTGAPPRSPSASGRPSRARPGSTRSARTVLALALAGLYTLRPRPDAGALRGHPRERTRDRARAARHDGAGPGRR
jgi:hypothetical protein